MTNCKNIFAPAICHNASRRLFIRQAGTLSAVAGAAAPLALNLLAAGSAAAQGASEYRAIVCLFMFGGNDSFNTVLPTDKETWSNYTKTRNQAPESIALMSPGTEPNLSAKVASPERLGGVLPIRLASSPEASSFALHPLLGSLQTLFNTDRRLAIVSNVGPLIKPTTKAQYGTVLHPRPARLFSHNDQQSTWLSGHGEGALNGWGGRMADIVAAGNTEAVFTAVSAGGNTIWLTGQNVNQYQVGSGGALRLGVDNNGQTYNSAAVASSLESIVSRSMGSHVFAADVASIAKRSINAEGLLRNSLSPASVAPFGTPPVASGGYNPEADPMLQFQNPLTDTRMFNPIAQQLQVVARLIEAGKSGVTGVRRQLFFVSMGGFDTHNNQNSMHAGLMAKLAHAMSYFDSTLMALGAQNNVTTFTGSDFGRTFTSNGDGTDHGWGAHQFVMGGAVRGGEIYGRIPKLVARTPGTNTFDGSPDQVRNGAMLPTTSVDQLGATLGHWFGLSDNQKLEVFPNLSNFNTQERNLGFMMT